MMRNLCGLVLGFVSVCLLGCNKGQVPATQVKKLPEVKASIPVAKDVIDYEDFTGRMEACKSVEIRGRVTGYLKSLHFQDGEEVKQDQLLFEIDPRPFKAALAQAQANLRLADAHLKRLDADFRRSQDLFKSKTISREDFDKTSGDRDEAAEAVGVAKANRDTAEINLDYTQVKAPVAGRISRRMIDPGNLVKADDTLLTRINCLDSMYVNFDINERSFIRLRRLVKDGEISVQENRAKVRLRLADESEYLDAKGKPVHEGIIDFEDNQLDSGTGTYRVRAEVPNQDRFFSPGLFVRVRLPIGKPHPAFLISEQALGTDQDQKFVFKLDDQNKTVVQAVEVGRKHDGLIEIKGEGLKATDRIIVNGLQRVRKGDEVMPKEVPMPVAALIPVRGGSLNSGDKKPGKDN
ncbi:MAG TPA: efflux RND transporter periplasmic adaptor subunit [Gemmataceae bacterium]|nr:efflux RND transporter periplasmic adaptor subunit [Gemmataceae bacterium]